jgi:integrative and conjugative element protein (TIGR02256 family)
LQRERSLPHETGGVLLAHFDVQRHNVYVCHQIPAPPDSVKQPTVYIRGSEGLSSEYDRIRKATGNGLAYIGEWHSHPDGAACSPSEDDILAGAWLAQETRLTSMPGLMLIVGQCDATCWMLCQRDMGSDAPVHLSLCWRAKE